MGRVRSRIPYRRGYERLKAGKDARQSRGNQKLDIGIVFCLDDLIERADQRSIELR